jgi:putative CocE/NonD family hydrolase
MAHPAYDSFWQDQAVDKLLAKEPLTVPVMLVHSLWDQEDIYGAPAAYAVLKPKDTGNDMVFLTLGPWHHGQEIGDGSHSGHIAWDQDAAKWWRWHVLAPFLAHYLKGETMDVAPVTAFQSGTNEWQRLPAWPAQPATAKLYLKPGQALGFTAAEGGAQTADYVSDPAHPVTFVARPIRPVTYDDDHWTDWLTTDQRNAAARPDVLSFTSELLTAPVAIAGQPIVHLTASTSGTDCDWVVKLIDVYPDQVPVDRASMGGYQLAVGHGHLPRPLPRILHHPKPIDAERPARLPLRAAPHQPRLPARPPDHGAGAVELVPALRPQPADLRAQHLFRQAGGLS